MKRKNNYLSIIVFAVLCVILAASVSIVVIAYINKMFQYQYEKYTDLEYTILEKPLDKKYMLDDFDILYNTIIENQMLE